MPTKFRIFCAIGKVGPTGGSDDCAQPVFCHQNDVTFRQLAILLNLPTTCASKVVSKIFRLDVIPPKKNP